MNDEDNDKVKDLLDQLFGCLYDAMDCLRRMEKINKMHTSKNKEKIAVDGEVKGIDKE